MRSSSLWRATTPSLHTITLLLSTTLVQSGAQLPEPLSISPSQFWDGNDGPWSSFDIGIGTPPQHVRVFPSTASYQTLAVLPQGCASASDLSACIDARGGNFNNTQSATWRGLNIYDIGVEENLGYYSNAEYGFDNVLLSAQGSNGLSENSTVGAMAGLDFYTGILGLNPMSTNFTTSSSSPSFLTLLKQSAQIPSLSVGYTAGAQYRFQGVPGSLTLGGFDANRIVPNDVTFGFAPNKYRELVVAITSISSSSNGDLIPLLTNPVYASIDSTVGQIWLPQDVCRRFESAFNLSYDHTSELYLVSDQLHESLRKANPNVTFGISVGISDSPAINITLPYAAFDLNAIPPFQNQTTTSKYFPIRHANSSRQYTLGRTFLQEAYLSVDWENRVFNISQVSWQDKAPQHLVPITPADMTPFSHTNADASNGRSGMLGGGIIVGVAIPLSIAIIVATLAFAYLYRRRQKQKREALQAKVNGLDEPFDDATLSPKHTKEGIGHFNVDGHVVPKVELDAGDLPADCHQQVAFAKVMDSNSMCSPYAPSTMLSSSGRNDSTASSTQLVTPVNAGPPVEVENTEREIYEMPGDMPQPQELTGLPLGLTAKEEAIERERMYNGVNPRNAS